jgi:hypothetical protein
VVKKNLTTESTEGTASYSVSVLIKFRCVSPRSCPPQCERRADQNRFELLGFFLSREKGGTKSPKYRKVVLFSLLP